MLLLVLVLGSSIIFIILNEGTSETYRCPYCAQIVVGQHHRLKCSLLNTRQSNVPVPSEVHPRRVPPGRESRQVGHEEVRNGASRLQKQDRVLSARSLRPAGL